MRVIVTGAAGFIGYHTAEALLARGDEVVGLDNLDDYYDVSLKLARLERLKRQPRFSFVKDDLADMAAMQRLFAATKPQRVVHLGAQAGVRYSISNPHAYIASNITGFLNVLEGCKANAVEHLVYASSSSVYGANSKTPFSVDDRVDHPVSLYAASKKSNELMAHVYAHLHRLPVTGLRFFTVYGPWGRPDMALFKFTKAILEGRPIELYNHGNHARDFTYVADIVEGVVRTLDRVAAPDPAWSSASPDAARSSAPYCVYNIGNSAPEQLLDLIGCLERELNLTARRVLLPMQPGDVLETYADVTSLSRDVGFTPRTPLADGVGYFVRWYRDYYAC